MLVHCAISHGILLWSLYLFSLVKQIHFFFQQCLLYYILLLVIWTEITGVLSTMDQAQTSGWDTVIRTICPPGANRKKAHTLANKIQCLRGNN